MNGSIPLDAAAMNGSSLCALVAAAAAVFTALVFLRAAWHKLGDVELFTARLAEYRMVPAEALAGAARGVVAAEISVAAMLFVPSLQRIGTGASISLLLIYSAAMAGNLMQGRRELNCGCGADGQRIGWPLVARNAALAGIAALPLQSGEAGLSGLERITAIASAFCLWIGFLLVEQLLVNAARMRWDTPERAP